MGCGVNLVPGRDGVVAVQKSGNDGRSTRIGTVLFDGFAEILAEDATVVGKVLRSAKSIRDGFADGCRTACEDEDIARHVGMLATRGNRSVNAAAMRLSNSGLDASGYAAALLELEDAVVDYVRVRRNVNPVRIDFHDASGRYKRFPRHDHVCACGGRSFVVSTWRELDADSVLDAMLGNKSGHTDGLTVNVKNR